MGTVNLARLGRGDIQTTPFAHILLEEALEPALYESLCATFPDCPPNRGPTGFTLFWGDPSFDRLIEEDQAWGTLFRMFQSQAFVDAAVTVFAEEIRRESSLDPAVVRYVAHQESREAKLLAVVSEPLTEPEELFVRMDIMQGLRGYHRLPHIDYRRRVVTMLIYFCDADEARMTGGDLVLHGPGGRRKVRPAHNRAVLFPCSPGSVHSVSPILWQAAPRNFIQVTVSSSVAVWGGMSPAPTLSDRAMA